MEATIKTVFKVLFFISAFFYQNSGELLIMLSIMYFPCVYMFSFIDKKLTEN